MSDSNKTVAWQWHVSQAPAQAAQHAAPGSKSRAHQFHLADKLCIKKTRVMKTILKVSLLLQDLRIVVDRSA